MTLLNDLLDSAKIESGKLGLESAPFSLRRMLDELTRALSQRAGEKRLRFFCRTADTVPDAVVGDRMRLLQVLLNLAGNAIKFTESGEVAVSVEVGSGESGKRGTGGHPETTRQGAASREQRAGSGERGENCKLQIANCKSQISDFKSEISDPQTEMCDLRFAIRDTGIGIPPSAQERLFQPFTQADASMARRFGGTGLGLSICKSLAEMMGGRIWVESEVGKGSTFYFTVCLPVTKESPPTPRPRWRPSLRPPPRCGSCWWKTTPPTRNWLPTSCRSGATPSRLRATATRQST